MCAEGADGARRPLRSRPVVCSCVWVWGPGGQGAGAAQGRAGTPGGSPGPWVCMVLQLTRAGSSLGPICTQQETEAQRGGDMGGSHGLRRKRTPPRPRPCTQPCLGVPGGTRWVCRAEEGTFLPCAVCRPAQAAPAAPGPAPLPASQGDPGRGGPVLAQVERDVALARPVLEPGFLPRQQHGALGRAVPGARIHAPGHVRGPASPLRTVGVSGEQRWLLWLRGGDLPAGHTARGAGLRAQPNGRHAAAAPLPSGPRAQSGPVNQASCMVMGSEATPA